MRFGMYLRELSRAPVAVLASALVAALAALWTVAGVSLSPPGLHPRSLEMASAYTQVMVDTPDSTLFDLRQNTDDISNMTSRSLLVGSLMASPPVLAYIARDVGVPVDRLEIQAPRTPAEPAVSAVPGRSNGPLDLFRSTDQYRLDIEADPIAPFLDVYAQAPTARAAGLLANGAVTGLADYLRALAATQGTPPDMEVQLRQFGRAQGVVIDKGIDLQVASLTFLFVFAGGCATALGIARVKRGWRLEAASA